MTAIEKSRQDQNNVYSILGVTEAGEVRAIKTDEDGNLMVSVALRSPDGTLYKLKVANGGGLSTEAV